MRLVGLIGAISLVVLSFLPTTAEGQNAILRSAPSQLEVGTGQIASLDVVLADAQNVYGIDVSATFDPQLVEVVDADLAKDGIQAAPGAFPKPDFVARNMVDNQAGTLQYAVTQVNPSEPVNGTGIVFTVQFRAKATSGQGAFTITSVDLTDRDGIALGVQPESGVIRIVPGGQVTPTTAPPTATASPTTAVTPIIPTSTPTDAPPPAAADAATPAVSTSTSASPPAPVETPAPPIAVASSSAPAVAAQIALPTDTPAGPTQPPAAIPAEAAVQSNATPEPPSSQAIAAAPALATATPAGAQPAAPVGNGAEPRASAKAFKSTAPNQAMPDRLPRRPPNTERASAGRSPSNDPSRLLLAIGIGALAVAAVTAVLILLLLRR